MNIATKNHLELQVIKTKVMGPNQLLVWSQVTETNRSLFKKETKIHYQYSTIQDGFLVQSVNTDTLQDADDKHTTLIANHFYIEAFREEMFSIKPARKAKIVRLVK